MFSWTTKGVNTGSSRGCLNGGRDASTPPHPPKIDESKSSSSPPPPPAQNYLLMVRNNKAMLYTISSREVKDRAVTRIQSVVRQFLSRHVVLKRINHIYTTLLHRCALIIQKLVRTVYRKKRSRDRHYYETSRRVHILIIQGAVRGWLARTHFRKILHNKVRLLVYMNMYACNLLFASSLIISFVFYEYHRTWTGQLTRLLYFSSHIVEGELLTKWRKNWPKNETNWGNITNVLQKYKVEYILWH